MKISREQTETIIKNGQKNGLTGQKVLDGLIERGYEPEGIDVALWKANKQKSETLVLNKNSEGLEFQEGRAKETADDFKEIGNDIIEGSDKRAENINEIKTKMETGEKGDVPAILEVAGQLAGAGADAIGSVFKGAVKIALSPRTENALKDTISKVGEEVASKPEVQQIVNWYNNLPDEKKDALDAAGGAAALASEFIGVGVTKRIAGVAEEGLNMATDASKTAIKQGSEAVTEAGKKAVGVAGKVVENKTPKLLSIFTGEKDDVVRSALENPESADLGIQGGDEALRAAVKTGSESSIKAKTTFIESYTEAFKSLVAKSGTKKVVQGKKLLYDFVDDLKTSGVSIKNGKLDFSTSKIVANPGEISKINAAYEAIKKWKDFSLEGSNKLKQLIGGLTKFANEAGGSSKSPFLGSFYKKLDDRIIEALPDSSKEAYIQMNKKFSDSIDLYDEMVDAFNSGDPFTKLAQIFGNNKDTLRQIVDFYEKTTGNKIAPIVAGRTLAESKPASFGFLNPRQWIDFFIDPKTQATIVTKIGNKIKQAKKEVKAIGEGNLSIPGETQTVELPDGTSISGVVESRDLRSLKPAKGPIKDYYNETSKGYANGDIVKDINTENEMPINVGKLTDPNQLPPIVIDSKGNILDGNHRWSAAIIADLKTINVIIKK